MRIRYSLPEAFFEEGFNERTDPFENRELAERLTHLFKNLEHGTVSILDGRWGTGKTVFAKQWVHHLRSEGLPAIYFDAFATDYIDDPFQAVSSAFIRAAAEAKQTESPVYKRFLSNAAKAGKAMASTAAKIGTKVVTLGVIGAAEIDQLSNIKDELSSSAGDLSEDAVRQVLESQAGSEATFNELTKSLRELPSLLAPATEPNGESSAKESKSLVVVVDELDRCRPDFALGILESLKHFFRTDGVHFVLVTNMGHLQLSVQNRYGVGEAAHEYLQKFYDFIIHFETRYQEHRGPNSAVYVKRLLAEIIPKHVAPSEAHDLGELLSRIAVAYNLTLRQAESLVTNVALAYLAVRDQEFRPRVLICFMALTKALRPDIYHGMKIGRFSISDFSAFLYEGSWKGLDVEHIRRLFRWYGDPTVDPASDEFKDYGSDLFRFHFNDRLDILPYMANAIMDRFGKT